MKTEAPPLDGNLLNDVVMGWDGARSQPEEFFTAFEITVIMA